jgi:hypothetical protein
LSAIAAVLDMLSPFLNCGGTPPRRLGTIYVYQMPATTHLFACSNRSIASQHKYEIWHSR